MEETFNFHYFVSNHANASIKFAKSLNVSSYKNCVCTGLGHISVNGLCLKAMLKLLKSIIIESHVIVTGPYDFSTLLYFTLKCNSRTKLLVLNLFYVT